MIALWHWFLGSRVGRWAAAIAGVLVALAVLRAKWRAGGRRAAELEGARRAIDTLTDQEKDHDEVVDIVRHNDGYDELRDQWTRKRERPEVD